jgi:curli biogenesis system outer membrane secretion channel CsgG
MKRKVTLVMAALMVAAAVMPLAPLAAANEKPRIAVLAFQNKADNQWWGHGGAEAAQDVFVTELVKSGKFRVIEREQIAAIMQEKGLTLSGDVDAATAMKIGKLLGVQYMLAGAVTEYGVTDKGAHGRGIGRLPGFNAGKRSFVAAMNARIFSVNTGEILWADEARAEESSVKVSVGGFGGGVDDERMFDKVMKPVIQELTASIKAADL